ncbi:MAG: hypothetical protein ACRCZK_04285 [Oscillospiraceae bacterium]
MLKNKFRSVIKYHIYLNKYQTLCLFLIMTLNLFIGVILKNNNDTGGNMEFVSFIFAFILGSIICGKTFKFAILNAVSRKTYFLASLVTTIGVCLSWSSALTLTIIISKNIASNFILFDSLYHLYSFNYFSMFIWYFSTILFFSCFGLLNYTLMTFLNKKVKLFLLFILIMIVPILILLNTFINGIIEKILKFSLLSLGITKTTSNPYLSAIILILFSFIFSFIIWLFFKKAEFN